MKDEVLRFCPSCFASSTDGSWGHGVVNTYCTNCGNGSTVDLPRWAIDEIRRTASWVGKRFYPCEEDFEIRDERQALLALVEKFPGRSAEWDEEYGDWKVRQDLPHGRYVVTTAKGATADEAMRACGLTYVPESKLRKD